MARVRLSSSFRPYTGGETQVEVCAANVRQLLERLAATHPELADHLEHGVAVAIDGVIYQDALLQPIADGSEVVLIDRIAGG
ncbi:MoaD/ThiS family protein [Ramlibacter lithotrophicus]|uniref:MoaD/ThiS family protein n=1 Tax=Ramlibacter lithotrophicus TaxID=2606681 RepID=UPI00192DB288